MDANEIMALKALDGNKGTDMSSYEHFMIAEKTSRRPSNAAITGVVLGGVGVLAGVAAWVSSSSYAHAKAQGNAALIAANQTNNSALMAYIANALATERQIREGETINLTQTLNDTQTGSQQGSIQSQIENSATAQAQATLMTQALLGNLSENAQKVQLYSAPQPCACPCSCGSNN